jgi:hypothetical protein
VTASSFTAHWHSGGGGGATGYRLGVSTSNTFTTYVPGCMIDWEALKEDFPILRERAHEHPVISPK